MYRRLFECIRLVTAPSSVEIFKNPVILYASFKSKCNLTMSQRSITSFFTKTPKKNNEYGEIAQTRHKSIDNENASPTNDGNIKRKSIKRQRIESSGSEKSAKSRTASPEIRKSKRQRIDSSSSEGSPQKKSIKIEEISPLKKKNDKEEITSLTVKEEENKVNGVIEGNIKIKKEVIISKEDRTSKENGIKKEDKSNCSVSVKSEKIKKNGAKAGDELNSCVSKKANKNKEIGIKEEDTTNIKKEKEVTAVSEKASKKEETGDDDLKSRVKEVDYNPAKSKYHPIHDACWNHGEPVPYIALANTLEQIEAISARLKMIEILSNYLRSVILLTPEDLLPSVYLVLNQLAPAYHGLELGIAETSLLRAVGGCTGRTLTQMKAGLAKEGDLGELALRARSSQRTLTAPSALLLRGVLQAFREVAGMTGHASMNKKVQKIQKMYIACRHSEAKYLIRGLQGKLRVGLAEQSVLQALASALAATPPQDWPPTQVDRQATTNPEAYKALVDEYALIIKTTYCSCPNYDMILKVVLTSGVESLPLHCGLTPGIPLKPMLAHPTRGVSEVLTRFENTEFTCEYKYDGERAQIHIPGETAPDFSSAQIFSRNQENNTSKYPDLTRRLPALLGPGVSSCVLDSEAVAFDVATEQILPFQVLSTRKRKDATEADIKIQVCVFVFDLLYLNGRSLVKEPLRVRRDLLRTHFNVVPGEWQFAVSRDCSSVESIQEFLEESVKGSCEGLMVKTLEGKDASYEIARRSHNWLKLKKDYLDGAGDTIDAVVIGAWHGRGKRAGVYGGFLLACYHPELDQYQSLCKIGTGFSDADLQHLAELLQEHIIQQPRGYYRVDSSLTPDVWFSCASVWEVRCADLSLSPLHHAAIGLLQPDKGISLRFPRFVRVRDDKRPEDATSAQQIADMYLGQDQVKNQVNKPTLNCDDFY